jgi:hypothetical protein
MEQRTTSSAASRISMSDTEFRHRAGSQRSRGNGKAVDEGKREEGKGVFHWEGSCVWLLLRRECFGAHEGVSVSGTLLNGSRFDFRKVFPRLHGWSAVTFRFATIPWLMEKIALKPALPTNPAEARRANPIPAVS